MNIKLHNNSKRRRYFGKTRRPYERPVKSHAWRTNYHGLVYAEREQRLPQRDPETGEPLIEKRKIWVGDSVTTRRGGAFMVGDYYASGALKGSRRR